MNVDQFLEDGFFKDLDEPTSSLSEELEEDGSDGDDNDDENVGENENIVFLFSHFTSLHFLTLTNFQI